MNRYSPMTPASAISGGPQGTTVECPWSSAKGSLGKPGAMKAEPAQGSMGSPQKVMQGKFAGHSNHASNTKQAAGGTLPYAPWPNVGTAYRGRVR